MTGKEHVRALAKSNLNLVGTCQKLRQEKLDLQAACMVLTSRAVHKVGGNWIIRDEDFTELLAAMQRAGF